MTVMSSLPDRYRALVVGASGGIGSALATVIGADPCCADLVQLSRRKDGLDVTDEDSVAAAADRVEHGFHLIVCATGALTIEGVGPEKSLRQISAKAMMNQFALNALGPALVIKHFAPKLARKERALMGVLSARVGSIGDNRLGGWISYRAAKAALNQIVRTSAIELSRTHATSVLLALHPGTVATALSQAYAGTHDRTEPMLSAQNLLAVLNAGTVADTGSFFAYDGKPIPW